MIRARLDGVAFEAAREQGARMTFDEAVELALGASG